MEQKQHPSQYLMIGLLTIIAILFAVAIYVSVHEEDGLTAWASLRSKSVREYTDACEGSGGAPALERSPQTDDVVFTCTLPDGSQEILTISRR